MFRSTTRSSLRMLKDVAKMKQQTKKIHEDGLVYQSNLISIYTEFEKVQESLHGKPTIDSIHRLKKAALNGIRYHSTQIKMYEKEIDEKKGRLLNLLAASFPNTKPKKVLQDPLKFSNKLDSVKKEAARYVDNTQKYSNNLKFLNEAQEKCRTINQFVNNRAELQSLQKKSNAIYQNSQMHDSRETNKPGEENKPHRKSKSKKGTSFEDRFIEDQEENTNRYHFQY